MAWLCGGRAAFAFVGCAKSEHYLRYADGSPRGALPGLAGVAEALLGRTSVYNGIERRAMASPRCVAVLPRDALTASVLAGALPARAKAKVYDLGNPMMDGLEDGGVLPREEMEGEEEEDGQGRGGAGRLTVALLPGSRHPESLRNFEACLDAAGEIARRGEPSVRFLAPLAPSAPAEAYVAAAVERGWRPVEGGVGDGSLRRLGLAGCEATLDVAHGVGFADALLRASCCIATAGTATEQAVGLGHVAFTFPMAGPQFTAAFAEAQVRLLGAEAVRLVPSPEHVADGLLAWHAGGAPARALARAHGRARMGTPGAAARIAERLLKAST